ncbi:hypothetical protein QBC40DRAFT_301899 [Triangularia verruculosa]|uniref:Rhodopsin domain-containing protein n=1 Tax=Triangularia verruculosa TaxID=2587418 RepID=A0AAN6X5Y0_9PEZI|nr:hypothetical protein QBC40DRAFT_301899 [Triangularia verruculosa]
MAFEVFKDSTAGAYFVILAVTGLLSLIACGLRFLATIRTGRKPGLEDWLAASAVVVYLIRVISVMYGLSVINGRGLILAFDPPAFETSFKIIFLADLITMLDQTLAKFSICALYYRIFGVNSAYRRWIFILAALQGLTYLGLVILQCMMCRPVNKFWQWWAEGECFPFSTLLVAIEPPNSVIDFALVVLALFMIRSLHVQSNVKWKLSFLFGLGSLAGIFGFIKIGVSYGPDLAYTSTVLGLWAAVQSFATIVCCCAPVYKPLLPETGMWNRLRSKVSNISLRQRSTGNRSGVKEGGSSETGSQHDRPGWLRPDTSSTKGLAWTEARGASHSSERARLEAENFPMGSIKVHNRVEVV